MFDQARAAWTPHGLSLLRIISGLLFLEHGTAKYLELPHVAAFDSMTWSSMIGLAGIVEFTTGALLTVGLFTPIAAFLASGEMAVAYFTTWAPRSLLPILTPGGDLAVLYCFVFFYLIFAGGGPWSLDALLKRK